MRFRFALLFPILLLALLAGGCDASLDAFEKTGRAYSVFGYLDANADTQYVRVESLQDSTFAGGSSVNARVTSENVETGETTLWEGRIFRTNPNNIPVQVFTTTADLKPGATYRFRAERERDGATSTAEVTLAPAFPPLQLVSTPGLATPTLRIEGVERIGGVRADIDYELCTIHNCQRRQSTTYHLNDTTRAGPASWEVTIDWISQVLNPPPPYTIGEIFDLDVTVASASEAWPEYAEDNPPGGGPQGEALPPLGIGSNIENGVGFLGGAFTRTMDIQVDQ